MPTINGLVLRRILGRAEWAAPVPFGEDGWMLVRKNGDGMVIVTVAEFDGAEWIHASISHPHRMPIYADLMLLYHAAFAGAGQAYQIFVPEDEHVNIHEFALHLWGRLDGKPALPLFAENGTI
jgi:hypothetical protein